MNEAVRGASAVVPARLSTRSFRSTIILRLGQSLARPRRAQLVCAACHGTWAVRAMALDAASFCRDCLDRSRTPEPTELGGES